jgi:hypothetical protein
VRPRGVVCALTVVALCISSCSLSASNAPLRGSGFGFFATAADAGSRKDDLAVDVLQYKGPGPIEIVGVTPRMIGRLHFDGAFLLAAPDNNPGGAIEHAPFQVLAGESFTPISASHHPTIRQGSQQYLVVRVNIPSNKAAGATLSVEVDYLSGGSVHSTTNGLVVAMCRGGFTTVACDAISNQARAFTES